jgi:hypothetical protein
LRHWEAIDPERVLSLHFAERISRPQIRARSVGTSLIVAISAGASGAMRPPPLLSWPDPRVG